MTLLSTLLAGVLFGFALAAPPGPMNAIIAEESVLRGWAAGFRAGLGAMTADVLFFLLALAGVVAVVRRLPTLRTAMFVGGGLLMLYFAYGAATGATERFRGAGGGDGSSDGAGAAGGNGTTDGGGSGSADGGGNGTTDGGGSGSAQRVDVGESRGFSKALVLSLTNPYQILFWLTAGVGLLTPGTVDVLGYASDALAGAVVVETGHPALVVGLFGGVAAWIVGFPAALTAAERRMEALAPVIAAGSAVVLAGFGMYFLADGLFG